MVSILDVVFYVATLALLPGFLELPRVATAKLVMIMDILHWRKINEVFQVW